MRQLHFDHLLVPRWFTTPADKNLVIRHISDLLLFKDFTEVKFVIATSGL